MKVTAYQRPDFGTVQTLSRKRAIREYCVDCCGGVRSGADGPISCTDFGCPLYRFRSGMSCESAEEAGYRLDGMRGR